jgi:hypothetical protein
VRTARSTQSTLADDGSLDELSEITSLYAFVPFVFFFVPFVYGSQLTTGVSIRKFKFLLLGGRPMVGLQTLDLAIGVRVPASQPYHKTLPSNNFATIAAREFTPSFAKTRLR